MIHLDIIITIFNVNYMNLLLIIADYKNCQLEYLIHLDAINVMMAMFW